MYEVQKKVKPLLHSHFMGHPGSLTPAAIALAIPATIKRRFELQLRGRRQARNAQLQLPEGNPGCSGGAPNHPRSSSVTQSSPTADHVPPSQQPIHPSTVPLCPFQPSIPDHNRVEHHHGKLMAANHPSATRSRQANGDFHVVDVDRNRLRSRQLHLLPRRPELPGRVRRQGSRERRHINRNPLQRWRCPGS